MRNALIVFTLLASAYGQQTAGGNWRRTASHDAITGEKFTVFYLTAEHGVRSTNLPQLEAHCSAGRLKAVIFDTGGLIVGSAGTFSVLGLPQQTVRVRYEQGRKTKASVHFWNESSNFKMLFVDHGAFKRMLASDRVLIEFWRFGNEVVVDEFRPAGIDAQQLGAECGMRP